MTQPDSTALAATTTRNNWLICANCKHPNHCTKFCITPGGAMAGKMIEEAHAAQDTAHNTQQGTNSGRPCGNQNNTMPTPQVPQVNTAEATPTTGAATTVTINGQSYILTTAVNAALPPLVQSVLAAISMANYDHEEYMAVIATTNDPRALVNWRTHTLPVDNTTLANPVTYSATCTALACPELPFILDTGATCHISPEASDFKVLKAIPCHPVKGLCGSAIYAIGVGDIELHIVGGHTLCLTDVLYIPDSSVCLISVHSLNRSNDYLTLFNTNKCWVFNRSSTIIACGTLSSSKYLYVLTTKTPFVKHKKATTTHKTDSALHAKVPNLKTWHRRLGHCNIQAIIDMVKGSFLQGMQVDLSTQPSKCDHCALGKQTRTPVPKSQEGTKVDRRLGRVYMDCADRWRSLLAPEMCIQ